MLGKHTKKRNTYRVLVGKTQKRPHTKSRHRVEENIKTWIHLA